ncbi:TetR/AcrR family transcriptional regulator [Streptomyces sp. H27-D2]|uniref:TetR/AcrR family transcriptional regulator n=1 Tax=Streptomyces sp. H27-D2 TaxID=3046304 RepID=UPI002DBC103E|nr:TetR family transcriptional regulator [Streptomyces sp. H27-D2]MEC4016852.1 TetR family transcriptional regulator [Streptomyces sp. H27-D2]
MSPKAGSGASRDVGRDASPTNTRHDASPEPRNAPGDPAATEAPDRTPPRKSGDAPDHTPPRKRGRPSSAARAADEGPGARERILLAARAEFAARGYDKTSIRGIAKSADVDPALVHHYFGTKEQIFAAAIEVSFEPALKAADVMAAGPDGAGERLARYFFGIWENPVTRAPLLAVIRSALTHETAAAVLRGFVLRRMLSQVAADLEVPNPKFRAELAASQMIGVAILRYVLRVEPLASVDIEEIIEMVAPTLQRYLTER